MKLSNARKQQGSVLITTFLTMTILTMICATSLYVSSQNQNSGSQTSSWQQALSGAEAGIDLGVRALNTGLGRHPRRLALPGSGITHSSLHHLKPSSRLARVSAPRAVFLPDPITIITCLIRIIRVRSP